MEQITFVTINQHEPHHHHDDPSANSVLAIVLVLLLLNSLVNFQDHYYYLRLFLCSLPFYNAASPPSSKRPPISTSSLAAAAAAAAAQVDVAVDLKLSGSDVKTVMQRLRMFGSLSSEGDEGIGASEIVRTFEEEAVSLEEVKEAFYVFDQNCDGFIDARELGGVIRALGFGDLNEAECAELIRDFDENKDGFIDFRDFAKLVQRSFQ